MNARGLGKAAAAGRPGGLPLPRCALRGRSGPGLTASWFPGRGLTCCPFLRPIVPGTEQGTSRMMTGRANTQTQPWPWGVQGGQTPGQMHCRTRRTPGKVTDAKGKDAETTHTIGNRHHVLIVESMSHSCPDRWLEPGGGAPGGRRGGEGGGWPVGAHLGAGRISGTGWLAG